MRLTTGSEEREGRTLSQAWTPEMLPFQKKQRKRSPSWRLSPKARDGESGTWLLRVESNAARVCKMHVTVALARAISSEAGKEPDSSKFKSE